MVREKTATEGNPKEPEQILLPGSAAKRIFESIWFMTPEPERVLYVSPAFESIWGRRREELRSTNMF